jgi:hypothetical protein
VIHLSSLFLPLLQLATQEADCRKEADPDEKGSGPTRYVEAVIEDLERMVTVSEPDPDDTLTKIT